MSIIEFVETLLLVLGVGFIGIAIVITIAVIYIASQDTMEKRSGVESFENEDLTSIDFSDIVENHYDWKEYLS